MAAILPGTNAYMAVVPRLHRGNQRERQARRQSFWERGPRSSYVRPSSHGYPCQSLTVSPLDLIALHNKTVEKKTPPGQMYWMEITDGWAPLCKMLNKPVPKEPFPRVNDAAALNELIKGMMLATAGVWLVITIVIFTFIYLGVRSGILLPSSLGSFVAISAK